MKLDRLAALAAALAAATALAACVEESAGTPDPTATCRAGDAAKLDGKAAPDDARIMELTAASTVRRAKEGGALTMDYQPFRVTVITDDAGTKIIRASCG